jgi:hypothetical protein
MKEIGQTSLGNTISVLSHKGNGLFDTHARSPFYNPHLTENMSWVPIEA